MQAAIQRLRNRKDEEQGFTLIELMVVVLIIAILIAFAIPTFLGARKRAQDRSAQSSLRNGVTAAKTVFSDTESYAEVAGQMDLAALTDAEPALTYVASTVPSTKPKELSVDFVSATQIVTVAKSNSGSCFAARDTVAAGGAATEFAKVTGTCSADAGTFGTWQDKF